MRYYVRIDQDRKIVSSMMTNWLTDEYAEENNLVEVSENDYMSLESLSVDHDLYIDENNYLQAYQRLDHGMQAAKQYIDSLVTQKIASGFSYNNYKFKCSSYDQININNRAGYGGKYKTKTGDIVDLSVEQSIELKKSMMLHVDSVLETAWIVKDKLKSAETFEEIDVIKQTALSMLS